MPCTAPSLIRCLEEWTVHQTAKIVKVIRATPKNKCLIIFFYDSQYTNCIHVKVMPSLTIPSATLGLFPKGKEKKKSPYQPPVSKQHIRLFASVLKKENDTTCTAQLIDSSFYKCLHPWFTSLSCHPSYCISLVAFTRRFGMEQPWIQFHDTNRFRS